MNTLIYFVSSSKEKYDEIKEIVDAEENDGLKSLSIEVKWFKMDIPELQTDDFEELIKKKALAAFKKLQRPILVEHTAFRVHAFNELPGLQTSYFYSKMGYQEIVNYCKYKNDFQASAESIFCFCDGKSFFIEKEREEGHIKLHGMPTEGFAWDKIFSPAQNNDEDITYAELGIRKHERSMRKKAWQKLKSKIKSRLINLTVVKNQDEKIEELAKLIKNRKVLLFLGAGISASLGFPSWNSLIADLGQKNGFEKELFSLYGNNMMLAEYAGLKSKQNVYDYVKQQLEIKDDIKEKLRNSKLYQNLFDLNFPVIYTTNYDHLMEEYYEMKGHKYTKVVKIDDMNKVDFFDKDSTRIMKFHGDIDNKESIVLSESQYFSRMDFQSFLDVQFQADILHYHVLYLGYSLSDINIKLMLYLAGKRWKKSGERKTSYIFTATPNHIQKAVFESNNIITFSGNEANKEKATLDFLKFLHCKVQSVS